MRGHKRVQSMYRRTSLPSETVNGSNSAIDQCPQPCATSVTSDTDCVPGLCDISDRVASWIDSRDTAKATNDRVSVFFKGLPLIWAALEQQREVDLIAKCRQTSSTLLLIDDALSSLDEILTIASSGTRSYDKFAGYKSKLEKYKSSMSRGKDPSDEFILSVTELCEEIATVSENLKPLSDSSQKKGNSHIASLLDDYTQYMTRKKQLTNRDRWTEFIKSRKTACTNTDAPKMEASSDTTQKQCGSKQHIGHM